ncbi:hypothetical protein EBU58_07085 [bacterium]|nr:hypothetical protein [bacterium]
MGKTKHLMIFRFSSMGDVAMLVPVLRCLYAQNQNIQITLVTQDRFTPIFKEFSELQLILDHAEKLGVRPRIGMRTELLCGLDLLRERGMEDCLQLLHFHQGSQITNIRHIKAALNEAARVYTELARRGAGLKYLDVGGGLGVDYDGSQTNFESSVNYSLQEYANDVVYQVKNACDEAGVPHPTIISESGRAIVAYHSVLVFSVLGVSEQGRHLEVVEPPADAEQPLHDLMETYQNISLRNLLESFHDAQQALDTAIALFSSGYLPLDQRSAVEGLYFAICRKIVKLRSCWEPIRRFSATCITCLATPMPCMSASMRRGT